MATAFTDVQKWPGEANGPAQVGIGHNRPPVEKQGVADFNDAIDKHADLRQKILDLIGSAERAFVDDEESAGRAAELIRQMGAAEKIVDEERKKVKEPYLTAGRRIDETARTLIHRLSQAKVEVRRMTEDFMRKREAELAAERRRIEDQQRRDREAAERAAAAEIENAAAEGRAPVAEIVEAPIAVAARPVEQAKNEVRSDFGSTVSTRRVKVAVITDWAKAFKAVKSVPKVQDAIQTAVNALVRAGQTDIPGVEVKEDTSLTVR
jgi:hypothetical protein